MPQFPFFLAFKLVSLMPPLTGCEMKINNTPEEIVSLIALQEVLGSSVTRVWVRGSLCLPQPVAIGPMGGCPHLGTVTAPSVASQPCSFPPVLPDAVLPCFPTVFGSLVLSVGGTCLCLNCLPGSGE